MKTTLKTLAVACGAAIAATALPAAMAADEPEGDHSLAANVALVSNYMFRGQSQTDNGPAIQGGFDYTYNPLSLYAGTWASNVDQNGFAGANMEIDFYAGWRPTFDKLTVDAGVLYYAYPNSNEGGGSEVDTVEWKLGATYDFDFLAAGVTGFYSPDYFNYGPSHRFEFSLAVPLPEDFKLTAKYGVNVGYRDVSAGGYEGYGDWSIGISKEIFGLTLGLAYTDVTAVDDKATLCAAPFQCDGELVASISKSF